LGETIRESTSEAATLLSTTTYANTRQRVDTKRVVSGELLAK
jgi:hypothetical protein